MAGFYIAMWCFEIYNAVWGAVYTWLTSTINSLTYTLLINIF